MVKLPQNGSATEEKEKFSYFPPYTAYQTVQGFVDSLDPRALPRQIDKSMMRNLSGGAQRKLWAGLIFLGLIKADGQVTELLRELVLCKDDPERRKALMSSVIDQAYAPIIKDFDVATGTAKQLEDVFRGVPGLETSTLQEAIRFYIHARKSCGLEISPYISARQPRVAKTAPNKPRPTKNNGGTPIPPEVATVNEEVLPGMIRIPIYSPGKQAGMILIHEDLDEADCTMVNDLLMAYAKRRKVKE